VRTWARDFSVCCGSSGVPYFASPLLGLFSVIYVVLATVGKSHQFFASILAGITILPVHASYGISFPDLGRRLQAREFAIGRMRGIGNESPRNVHIPGRSLPLV
jgi:hypothetical protein